MKKIVMTVLTVLMLSSSVMPALASGGSSTTTTCTMINTYKVSSGYAPKTNSNVGAIWVEYKLNSCPSPSGQGIQITLSVTNKNTGEVISFHPSYASDKIDFDMLALETPYHVDFVVSDYATGQLIDSRSADVVTPKNNGLL